MTGDELAAVLYADQGYFVMYSEVPLAMDSIHEEDEWVRRRKPASIRFRVVGASSRQEYQAQRERAFKYTGEVPGTLPADARYFYRFEAAD